MVVPREHSVVVVVAKHAATTAHVAGAQSVSASSLLVQMVIGLVVVVALIKVTSHILHKRGSRVSAPARRQGAITVLGRQSLGKGVQVAVVAAAGQTYVIGVTAQQITVLGQPAPPAAAGGSGTETSREGGLQLLPGGSDLLAAAASASGWKSTLEQMRAKTVRRA